MGLPARRRTQQIDTLDDAADIISRQQAEIDELKRVVSGLAHIVNQLDVAVTEDVDAKIGGSIWGN